MSRRQEATPVLTIVRECASALLRDSQDDEQKQEAKTVFEQADKLLTDMG